MKLVLLSSKHYLLLLLFWGVTLKAFSQDKPYISGSAGTDKLNIITQSGTEIVSFNTQARNTGAYSIWLETGDGNYINSFSTGITNIPSLPFCVPPYMLATKLYEHHRPPPPSSSSAFNIATPSPVGKLSSPNLGQKLVTLFSNVRDMVGGDTMVFGISYYPKMQPKNTDTAISYKLVFRYNKKGQSTFVPITDASHKNQIADYATNNLVAIPDIRKFNNEAVSIANSIDDLGSYNNAVVFNNINANTSSNTFNIFISLVPQENPIGTASDLEVVLYYQKKMGGEWLVADSYGITGMQSVASHDPNSIRVSPTCLSLPQTTQVLHYTIDFQNTGKGDADKVITVFNIPDQMNLQRKIWNVKLTYAGNREILLKENTDYVIDNGKIIFTSAVTLRGCENLPNPVTNPETMGSITFDLEIAPGPDTQAPAILQAWAEIYFHSVPGTRAGVPVTPSPDCRITADMENEGLFIKGSAGFEMPVRTNNAITLFSKCCGDTQECNCRHPKNFLQWLQCYWWVSVIILLLVVIWWLYKKWRRQQ